MSEQAPSVGRPTDYKPEYAAQAEKLCALGATDIELADFFQVSTRTIYRWREESEQFATSSTYRPNWEAERAERTRQRNASRTARDKRRRETDHSYRLRKNVASRLHATLSGRTGGKLFSILPYTAEDLKRHLEQQFRNGMSWDNYGKWHVDHRKPCALFDMSDPEQFKECWSLENLQPLWAVDNIKKGARYACA